MGAGWLELPIRPVTQEMWYGAGWRKRSGYEPTGKGSDGVGNLAGYTPAEVAEVPKQRKMELLTYLQQVHSPLHTAIANLGPYDLFVVVEEQSIYERISNFIRDGYEHLVSNESRA